MAKKINKKSADTKVLAKKINFILRNSIEGI